MAKQNERQRSTDDPRDSEMGDEERIRGVEDIGGLPEEDEDDFEDAEDVEDDEEEAGY
jgi:hypothetical protein